MIIRNELVSANVKFKKLDDIGGEGRNSKVYKVEDPQLNAILAVKEVPVWEFRDAAAYFDEARLLYASRHPHVVPVLYAGIGEDGDHVYAAMPYYPNGSLQGIMKKRMLNLSEIIEYGLGFLTGLYYAHTLGIVHFDIKPTNVLLDESRGAMLTDFGLAKYTDPDGYAKPKKMYTKHYPPERFTDNSFTTLSDIYQAGLTLYRMCNGDAVFREQSQKFAPFDISGFADAVLKGEFPDRSLYLPHIPTSLRNAINKALSVEPTDRHESVVDLMNDLSRISQKNIWNYQVNSTLSAETWETRNKDVVRRIEIVKTGDTYTVCGRKVTPKSDQAVSAWSKNGFRGREKAHAHVRNIIRKEK